MEAFGTDTATDPVEGLVAVVALRRLAERLEAGYVRAARAQGVSWQQIGDALGITRQSAFTKHDSSTRDTSTHGQDLT